ncbi:type VI secretion system tip protein VgrG [Desulfatitalea alkaliphila]|uniref:Type VI secretion system tip protein VgrG n=1 Tax=Desulfatitalea alkaliphila TaxID=2929485 RepID=A0AA41R4X1_9BACT|nr:type VI secretion system tip protein VgrG [Desulfatitalea alkaliphila]MCJ8501786.1 type VI secretion system tip protein VgrG [Desulfatitalea alkaliphila]
MSLSSAANASRFFLEAGGHEWQIVDFTIDEKVSAPFQADVNLACEEEVPFEDIIGQNAVLTIESADGERYLHGIVNRFVHTGLAGRFLLYRARIVPQMWLLSLAQDCRIYQDQTVPDIVQQVLEESGITADLFDFRLKNQYPERTYCVQYRETDLAFVSRLLAEEGIFYFFEHSDEKHLLIFGDGPVNYQPIAGNDQVPLNIGSGTVAEEEAVLTFQMQQQLRPGKLTLKDFNFEKPSVDLTADQTDSENESREIYDYPGAYTTTEQGRKIARVRLQQETMAKTQADGTSVVPRFIPGCTFALTDHTIDRFNSEYLLVEVRHEGAQPQVLEEQTGAGGATRYENRFFAIPSSATVQPERKKAKPVMDGVQTAIVVGPSDEEIYTDAHGRVKVQFHWDRLGGRDENSSCWIRVSQAWAGAGWGAMFIPRIGHEVIVDFIEGDPDRPIVTGRVYHGTNSPPYTLPDEKSKSTLKSNTTKGGEGSNELRFEDEKGKEEVYLHAQKNWTIGVENDKNQTIGNDESLRVKNDREKKVDANQKETIGGNKTIDVTGAHKEKIGGNQTVNVGAKRNLTVNTEEVVNVGTNRTLKVGGIQKHTITGQNDLTCATEKYTVSGNRTVTAGTESKTVNGMRTLSANVESYTVSGNRNLTVGNETRTVTNQQTFLGMDVTTDSGAKFENFAGLKVSNAFALLMELKQISISVANASIGYTSFNLSQDGIKVNTNALHVIG